MRHPRGVDLSFQGFGVKSYRVLNGKTLETLKGLQQWEILGGQCATCSRVAWLDKMAVMRKIGGNQYLLNLRGKLKCECGNRLSNEVLIGYLDRNL